MVIIFHFSCDIESKVLFVPSSIIDYFLTENTAEPRCLDI